MLFRPDSIRSCNRCWSPCLQSRQPRCPRCRPRCCRCQRHPSFHRLKRPVRQRHPSFRRQKRPVRQRHCQDRLPFHPLRTARHRRPTHSRAMRPARDRRQPPACRIRQRSCARREGLCSLCRSRTRRRTRASVRLRMSDGCRFCRRMWPACRASCNPSRPRRPSYTSRRCTGAPRGTSLRSRPENGSRCSIAGPWWNKLPPRLPQRTTKTTRM
jgi:hypothetical protein